MLGTCDMNESLTEALVREVKEETNLNVRLVQPLSYVIEMYDLKIFSYLVEPVQKDQSVKLNYEASESGWFSPTQAQELELYGDTADILAEAEKIGHT